MRSASLAATVLVIIVGCDNVPPASRSSAGPAANAELSDGSGAVVATVAPHPPSSAPAKPWESGYAPQAYNKGSRGQDARYNTRINCTKRADGRYVDRRGFVYGDDGLCLGGRSGDPVAGLKPADEMDGREPSEPYEYQNRKIGPDKENYPAGSYEK